MGILLAMILAALGVIIACIYKKRKRQEDSKKNVNYAKVPQNQLSSLRFTTEAF